MTHKMNPKFRTAHNEVPSFKELAKDVNCSTCDASGARGARLGVAFKNRDSATLECLNCGAVSYVPAMGLKVEELAATTTTDDADA